MKAFSLSTWTTLLLVAVLSSRGAATTTAAAVSGLEKGSQDRLIGTTKMAKGVETKQKLTTKLRGRLPREKVVRPPAENKARNLQFLPIPVKPPVGIGGEEPSPSPPSDDPVPVPTAPAPTPKNPQPQPDPDTPRPTLRPLFEPTSPTQPAPSAPVAPVTLGPTLAGPPKLPTPVPTIAPASPVSPRPTTAPPTYKSSAPSESPTISATTAAPTKSPNKDPSSAPTETPSASPSKTTSQAPSNPPSETSSQVPSNAPSETSSQAPSTSPSEDPTATISEAPTASPSVEPTTEPTLAPTSPPTIKETTMNPTDVPSTSPSISPSLAPSSLRSNVNNFTAEPTIESSSSNPTEKVTEEPTIQPTKELAKALEKTLPPTFSDSNVPTTSVMDPYTQTPITTIGDLKDLETSLKSTLEFSLWFPAYRASQLNINVAESNVLNSLEVLFCSSGSPALTEDSFDSLCVLQDELLGSSVSMVMKSPRQSKDEEDPDATIVLAPYVDYLDERYAVDEEQKYFWTTWKVSFEMHQIGAPLLQRAITSLGETTEPTSEEIFVTSTGIVEDEMKTSLDAAVRSGRFDSILSSYFTRMDVFSSPVDSELEIFGAIEWTDPSVNNANMVEPEEDSDSKNMAIIAVIAVMAFLLFLSIGAYISLMRRRSKEVWRREREKQMMGFSNKASQEQPVRRLSPDNDSGPGEVSTLTNLRGSVVPAEIDVENMSLPTSFPMSRVTEAEMMDMESLPTRTDDGDSLPMSKPSLFVRKFFKEGTSFGERDYDVQSQVSSSVDLAWSESGVDAPWRPSPSVDFSKTRGSST